MTDLLKELKDKDYDKYLACLFADKDSKPKITAFFLFHHEIYDIPQSVSEPMVGKIKIQWWRDVIKEIEDGKPARPHPILQELKGSPELFPIMVDILDGYEKILDGLQPKNFIELTTILEQTMCKSFKVISNDFDDKLALAYSYQFIARKIVTNSGFAQKLNLVPEKLISSAKELLPKNKSVFKIITEHYIKLFEKNKLELAHKMEWKLATKLFFKNPSIF